MDILDMKNLLELLLVRNILCDNVLRVAFRYFDKDNSGEITFNEIKELFSQSIADKTKVHQTLQNIIKEFDANNDGKINFNEFSKVMKKMLK